MNFKAFIAAQRLRDFGNRCQRPEEETQGPNRVRWPINNHADTLQHPATMDHETLNTALAAASAASVAGHFGVNRRTIYRWCKSLSISRRVYRCPNPPLLRRLEAAGILQRDIARSFGVCRWTVRLWCKKLGIAHHTTGRFRKGTKGNVPQIHEEIPFGVGVLFDGSGSEVSNF